MMDEISKIVEALQSLPDGKILFEEPIEVAFAGLNQFTIYGAWLVGGTVWLMNGAGEWHGPLEETQMNADKLISALHVRLELLTNKTPA